MLQILHKIGDLVHFFCSEDTNNMPGRAAIFRAEDSSEDEWKPAQFEEGDNPVRKKRKTSPAKKTCVAPNIHDIITDVNIAAKMKKKKNAKKAAEWLSTFNEDDDTTIHSKYSQKERHRDAGTMLSFGFSVDFIDRSIEHWRSFGKRESFVGCSCQQHTWFLTAKGTTAARPIGWNDNEGENTFLLLLCCRGNYWPVRLVLHKGTGVGRIAWRAHRPEQWEPGFLPKLGPFVTFVLNRLYKSFLNRHYQRCSLENRCAEFAGDDTEERTVSETTEGSDKRAVLDYVVAGNTADVRSEMTDGSIRSAVSARPKRAAASGTKNYSEF